jgi:putative oxidoreductase
MKIATTIVGGLLGFLFVMISLMVLFGFAPKPELIPGTPKAAFFDAFGPTGWMTMVKLFELLGGILVAIPKTRNFGLLILGPIIINILAFHTLVAHGEGLVGLPLVVAFMALFLLWAGRGRFAGLMN